MAQPITLDEVLALKYLNDWKWSPREDVIAYTLDDGGVFDLWLVTGDGSEDARQLSGAKQGVTAFDWNPANGSLVYVQDGNLWLGEPSDSWYEVKQLTHTASTESAPAWSPDGNRLAFVRNEHIWVYDLHGQQDFELSLPGRIVTATFGPEPPLSWSPDGQKLAYRFLDNERRFQVGVCTPDSTALWRTMEEAAMAGGTSWLDDVTLLFSVSRELNTLVDFYVLDLADDAVQVLKDWRSAGLRYEPSAPASVEHIYRQKDEPVRGALRVSATHPSPDKQSILFALETDGWAHLYLYDRETSELRQLTTGECEDYGHAGDEPAWSPDGRYIAYSSNRSASAERQIWLYDVQTGQNSRLTDFTGTNSQPKWAPDGSRLAFVHCDPWRNMDLWSMSVKQSDNRMPVQLTRSMPDSWSMSKAVVPEEVTFKGALDWNIHGFVFTPPDYDPDESYPAVVWVHGGPVRQMRYGFHPMHSYAVFYAYHQYLAHRGYVSISLNFRGGIGYGRDFRNGLYHKMGVDDVADVVAAGRYLKKLPYVDENRVAVWGLSYGGYMTLHALTQYPEEFRMGINIAGIWDFAQWTRWVEGRWGKYGGLFKVFFGGDPDQSPELYRQGSPVTFKDNLSRPLINFHGTKDANVDFEQLDRIVKDCVELGKEYEAYYYPDEVHMFRYRRTWKDAFPKIEREFEKYLKPAESR